MFQRHCCALYGRVILTSYVFLSSRIFCTFLFMEIERGEIPFKCLPSSGNNSYVLKQFVSRSSLRNVCAHFLRSFRSPSTAGILLLQYVN